MYDYLHSKGAYSSSQYLKQVMWIIFISAEQKY